jgi:predicted KAP-like P-loop ATPase
VSEVKAYLILLFAEQSVRKEEITSDCYDTAKEKILDTIKKPWLGGLSLKAVTEAFGGCASSIEKQIDIADQLANIMATQEQLAGNPRLIKRFLNNLIIRERIANAQGMGIAFEALVKLQLFERCASLAAFDFLAKEVAESEDGKPIFITKVEEQIKSGKEYEAPDLSWDTPFIQEWLGIEPTLSGLDLRPLLHLSKDKIVSLAGVDELSEDAKEIFEALVAIKSLTIQQTIVKQIKVLGETEANQLLVRLKRRIASNEWSKYSLQGCLHIIKAYPSLNSSFLQLLSEIPAQKRLSSYIPILEKEPWIKEVLIAWTKDGQTPKTTISAIQSKIKEA